MLAKYDSGNSQSNVTKGYSLFMSISSLMSVAVYPVKNKRSLPTYRLMHNLCVDRGADIIENTVEICLHCHRMMHSFGFASDIIKLNSIES